ncbi:MAG: hypothetical protein OCD76_09580 [Reichenbachiella sp.]
MIQKALEIIGSITIVLFTIGCGDVVNAPVQSSSETIYDAAESSIGNQGVSSSALAGAPALLSSTPEESSSFQVVIESSSIHISVVAQSSDIYSSEESIEPIESLLLSSSIESSESSSIESFTSSSSIDSCEGCSVALPYRERKLFFIDSEDGNDSNSGSFPDEAWRSHTKISEIQLVPGDVIRFRRGSRFDGPLEINDSGNKVERITITAYGDGTAPEFTNSDETAMDGNSIKISGSWIVLEQLKFTQSLPAKSSKLSEDFTNAALHIAPGADHVWVKHNTFMQCYKGIQVSGEYTTIEYNWLEGPEKMERLGVFGPVGIQLGIGNQEVAHNSISNFIVLDVYYGQDGGAIQLNDGRNHKENIYIHHNKSKGNAEFLETSWEYDYMPLEQEVYNLRVAFNESRDAQSWVQIQAPCNDCFFDNNTIDRVNNFGSIFYNVVYTQVTGLTFRNNLFLYTDLIGEPYKGSGAFGNVLQSNWYFNVSNNFATHWDENRAGSGDPLLEDYVAGNFNPVVGSLLQGAGENLALEYTSDLNGVLLPEKGSWTIGAYQ